MTVFKKVHQWFNSDRKMVMESWFSRDGVDFNDVMFSDNLSLQRSVSGTVPSPNINSFLAERFYRM